MTEGKRKRLDELQSNELTSVPSNDRARDDDDKEGYYGKLLVWYCFKLIKLTTITPPNGRIFFIKSESVPATKERA